MKKVIALILFFLIIAAVLSYLGFIKHPIKSHESYGNVAGRQNNVSHADRRFSENFDEFFMKSHAKSFDEGEGSLTEIARKAPIDGGLGFLVLCSIGLAGIKLFDRKRQHK